MHYRRYDEGATGLYQWAGMVHRARWERKSRNKWFKVTLVCSGWSHHIGKEGLNAHRVQEGGPNCIACIAGEEKLWPGQH